MHIQHQFEQRITRVKAEFRKTKKSFFLNSSQLETRKFLGAYVEKKVDTNKYTKSRRGLIREEPPHLGWFDSFAFRAADFQIPHP